MPFCTVRQGVWKVRPQPVSSAPDVATKMPLVTSPSMPSQFSSAKLPSGTSVVEGGWQLPQPDAPEQVLDPAHAPKGVVMVQVLVPPCVLASQSHAPEDGRHCLKLEPPTLTSLQV